MMMMTTTIKRKAKMLVAALGVCPVCDHRILAVYDGTDWTVVLECKHLTGFDGVNFFFQPRSREEGDRTVVLSRTATPPRRTGDR